MPYKLRRWEEDPLAPQMNRGAGWYYGRGYGYFSKYDINRDRRKVNNKPIMNLRSSLRSPIGKPKSSAWLHITDGVIPFGHDRFGRKKRKSSFY